MLRATLSGCWWSPSTTSGSSTGASGRGPAFLVLVSGWMTSRGRAGTLLNCEPEEELVAKLDGLEEIWLGLKRIEEELQRISAELGRRDQLGS